MTDLSRYDLPTHKCSACDQGILWHQIHRMKAWCVWGIPSPTFTSAECASVMAVLRGEIYKVPPPIQDPLPL